MKNILFILLILLGACKSRQQINDSIKEKQIIKKDSNSHFQPLNTFKGDTLKYIKINLLKYQDYYKGKPLNVLLNDLELQVNYYYVTTSAKNKNVSSSLAISYYSMSRAKEKIANKESLSLIVIKWETPLPTEKVHELLRKNNRKWTEDEKNYYGQQIIKEIEIPN